MRSLYHHEGEEAGWVIAHRALLASWARGSGLKAPALELDSLSSNSISSHFAFLSLSMQCLDWDEDLTYLTWLWGLSEVIMTSPWLVHALL